VGKWAETAETLMYQRFARGHFSKKSGQKPKFFGQKLTKPFFDRFYAQKKWAKAQVLRPKVGRKTNSLCIKHRLNSS